MWYSVSSLVHLGCPGALYSWCMRVVLSATRCVLNWYHILRYSGALCRARALACDNLVVKIFSMYCIVHCFCIVFQHCVFGSLFIIAHCSHIV